MSTDHCIWKEITLDEFNRRVFAVDMTLTEQSNQFELCMSLMTKCGERRAEITFDQLSIDEMLIISQKMLTVLSYYHENGNTIERVVDILKSLEKK